MKVSKPKYIKPITSHYGEIFNLDDTIKRRKKDEITKWNFLLFSLPYHKESMYLSCMIHASKGSTWRQEPKKISLHTEPFKAMQKRL